MKPIDLEQLAREISDLTGEVPTRYQGIRNDATFEIAAGHLPAILKMIDKVFGCYHLSAITAQQRDGEEECFEVLYHFWHGTGFSLRMQLPLIKPELPSMISILPGADFYEREVAEMFGITFTGREETPHLLLPDDWAEGPPLRRKEA